MRGLVLALLCAAGAALSAPTQFDLSIAGTRTHYVGCVDIPPCPPLVSAWAGYLILKTTGIADGVYSIADGSLTFLSLGVDDLSFTTADAGARSGTVAATVSDGAIAGLSGYTGPLDIEQSAMFDGLGVQFTFYGTYPIVYAGSITQTRASEVPEPGNSILLLAGLLLAPALWLHRSVLAARKSVP